MLKVARFRLLDIANPRQVAELEPRGIADARIADDPVPWPPGPIRIIPTAHQIRLAVAREIHQPGRKRQGEGAGLTGVVTQ